MLVKEKPLDFVLAFTQFYVWYTLVIQGKTYYQYKIIHSMFQYIHCTLKNLSKDILFVQW